MLLDFGQENTNKEVRRHQELPLLICIEGKKRVPSVSQMVAMINVSWTQYPQGWDFLWVPSDSQSIYQVAFKAKSPTDGIGALSGHGISGLDWLDTLPKNVAAIRRI